MSHYALTKAAIMETLTAHIDRIKGRDTGFHKQAAAGKASFRKLKRYASKDQVEQILANWG